MTWREYRDVVDATRKSHDSGAYRSDLSDLDVPYLAYADFDILVRRFRSRGLPFELRVKEEPLVHYRRTPDDLDYLRDAAGALVPYTEREVDERGWKRVDYTIGVFDRERRCVAAVQDEWGCVLVRVAEEYAGFGLGVELTRMALALEPTKPSGGFTPQGYATCLKAHRELVRAALLEGRYRRLVEEGSITRERALEIVRTAGLGRRLVARPDVATDDPSNWAIYASEHGAFVVYDKRLRDLVDGNEDNWTESAVKGYALVRIPGEAGLLVRYGGESPAIKRFLMACASSYCEREGVPLAVDVEDLDFVDPDRMRRMSAPSNRTGAMRVETRAIVDGAVDLAIAAVEEAWRKSFDRYGEFHDRMLEVAESKFAPECASPGP